MMLMAAAPAYAQGGLPKNVSIQVEDTVLTISNKELKDITVRVKNDGTEPFKGTIAILCGNGAKVATKSKVDVSIEPGKQIFVPSKIYVNQNAPEGSIPLSFTVKSATGALIDSALVALKLAASRLLTITLESYDLVLPKTGDLINIPIQISNHGNVGQGGVLVIAFPSALKDKTNKSIKFYLESFKDTVIVFQRKATRDMARLGSMIVTINGLYDDGNMFGADVVSIQNLASKRSYEEGLGENSLMRSNYITTGVMNAFNVGESYYVRSHADYKIADGHIGYNFNINKWKQGDQSTAISATTLDVAYKRVGAHLGNIIQTGDLSYTGRGGELYLNLDSLGGKKIIGGFLDKSINLFSTNNTNISYGNDTWLGYRYEKNRLLNLTTYAHDLDNIYKVKSDLLVDNLSWKLADHFSTDVKLAMGNSVSTNGSNESNKSYAAGLNYYGVFADRLTLSGSNSYASAYYPGSRRGMLYLNEGAFLKNGKSTISASFTYSNSAPKYMNQFNVGVSSQDQYTTAEVSYAKRMAGGLTLSIIPNYYTENGNWYYNNSIQNGSMSSVRLSSLITYNPARTQQSLYFRTDLGGYQTGFSDTVKLQFRSSLTYNIRNFRIVGTVQKGNFYLAEAFQEYFAGFNAFRLNIAPSVTQYFFNRSLKWDAGVAYSRDVYSNTFLVNSNLAYVIGPVAAFSNVQYNFYSNARTYKNIQFGLTYFLPDNQTGKKVEKSKIEVFTYYDLNHNGTYDKTDSIASGIVVHIGKTILMSGRDGRVVYDKLPAGNYSIYLPTQNGWYGRDQFVNLKEKDTRSFKIPLTETGVIHGSISYEFDSTFSFSITRDKAWQSIVATNADGVRFETKTDEAGNYNLYLPIGVYSVIVDNLPNQVQLVLKGNNVQPLHITSGQIISNVDFILKVKQRNVQIKKFGK
jgi:hypothetical protein